MRAHIHIHIYTYTYIHTYVLYIHTATIKLYANEVIVRLQRALCLYILYYVYYRCTRTSIIYIRHYVYAHTTTTYTRLYYYNVMCCTHIRIYRLYDGRKTLRRCIIAVVVVIIIIKSTFNTFRAAAVARQTDLHVGVQLFDFRPTPFTIEHRRRHHRVFIV